MEEKKQQQIIEVTHYVCPICGYEDKDKKRVEECAERPVEKLNLEVSDIVKLKDIYDKRLFRKPKPIYCRVINITGPQQPSYSSAHTYRIIVKPLNPKRNYPNEHIYFSQGKFELIQKHPSPELIDLLKKVCF